MARTPEPPPAEEPGEAAGGPVPIAPEPARAGPPFQPVTTKQFERDWKLCKKRGKDMGQIRTVMDALLAGEQLAARHKDHLLSGQWGGRRECHVQPDWLLIYLPGESEIVFERTGTHSDLF